MRPLNAWKIPFACALTVAGVPLVLAFLTHNVPAVLVDSMPAAMVPATGNVVDPKSTEISLRDALGRNWVVAQYSGNGHDEIRALFTNRSNNPLRLTLESGMIFESADLAHQMVLTRADSIPLAPGEKRFARLTSAATRTSNPLKDLPYHLCPENLQSLTALFAHADNNPEISRDAIQTAILLLTENAPLATFAKFSLLAEDPSAPKQTTNVYQVNTNEILAAFELIKDAGYSRLNIAAAHDPQLKIESMIDPLSHAAALHYYGIATEKEWAYWRAELQTGDVSTRHYALYGIGRYYPDVALEMLPAWARAKQLSSLYRTSAIQAMAETHRAEAISVLQQLVSEFGAATALGESARKSIAYLENQRSVLPANGSLVEFRVSQADVH